MLENLNTRVSIILFVIAVSWYFLIPTIKLYNNSNLSTEEIQQLDKDAINLGLDLKGGLRIVLELDDAVYFKNELTVGLRKASKIEAENFIDKSLSYAKKEKIDILKAISKIATQDQIKLNIYYADIS